MQCFFHITDQCSSWQIFCYNFFISILTVVLKFNPGIDDGKYFSEEGNFFAMAVDDDLIMSNFNV